MIIFCDFLVFPDLIGGAYSGILFPNNKIIIEESFLVNKDDLYFKYFLFLNNLDFAFEFNFKIENKFDLSFRSDFSLEFGIFYIK